MYANRFNTVVSGSMLRAISHSSRFVTDFSFNVVSLNRTSRSCDDPIASATAALSTRQKNSPFTTGLVCSGTPLETEMPSTLTPY